MKQAFKQYLGAGKPGDVKANWPDLARACQWIRGAGGVPVLAHGCAFNRYSTEDKARYFDSAKELAEKLRNLNPEDAIQIGANMREIAQRKYTWDQIGKAYFELLDHA